jgi:hypothetical protein
MPIRTVIGSFPVEVLPRGPKLLDASPAAITLALPLTDKGVDSLE